MMILRRLVIIIILSICGNINADSLEISKNENGTIAIVNNKSESQELIIDADIKIPSDCNKIVIVTHGWVDRGKGRFAEDIADAIKGSVDSNEWMCGYFEWRDGAMVFNSIKSAENARDIAGPQLAKAILSLGAFKHIHLIGHSAGCWAIDSAAKIIEKQTTAQIHLTFLDAYVPRKWDESELGKLENTKIKWIEHYYTRDLTFGVTQANLSHAYTVDITKPDPGLTEHKFPLRWYYATVTGHYNKNDYRFGSKVINEYDGIEYGFARSLEAGKENWQKSLKLKENQKAVMIIK